MATILLVGVELLTRTKLEGMLPQHRFITADGVEKPDLVIADITRVDPEEVTDLHPDAPIVGFTHHTDTAGLRGAHAAGFDQVIVRSAFFERAGELIDGLIASVE